VALTLLAAFMLASIGGRYTWPILPAVIGAAGLFLLSGVRVGADAVTRSLDFVLVAALAVVGLQMMPLPPAVLRALSPATASLQDAYTLQPLGTWRPISVHAGATRAGFALALAAAFVFWGAREAFSHGGTRAATRLLAWIGFACALVSLAQRATAPGTVLWKWTVPDPRAAPFGPFVDRNQLATWLVLTISVVAGYLVMRVRAHMTDRMRHGAHAVIVALSDGGAVAMLGCLTAMLIALAATLSRSGFVALIAAAVVGTSLSRRDHKRGLWVGVAVGTALVAVAAWLNVQSLAERITTTLSTPDPDTVSRLTIWRDTLRIIRAFPVFGTGVGTFADAMFVYQQTARQVLFNHAHNEYLQLLTEGGAIMLAIVFAGCVLLVRAARAGLAGDQSPHRYIRIGACAALAAVAVQSIWETGLRAPANLLLAAILAALAVRPLDRRVPSSEITPA
jgi:O-antigen ligase